jgi:predicted alpha/beta-hydrolase family hydrolase
VTDVAIEIPDVGRVSGIAETPADACAGYVFAHGAGAGMRHPFMSRFAGDLAAHGVATLRFQFPFMEAGSKRPDSPRVARAAVRAAVGAAAARWPALPLYAGGKSFGGRMTSQAQADGALAGVRGLVFVGFPLHPAGKPGTERAEHLRNVTIPMLFLGGTRDELADLALLRGIVAGLAPRATLELYEDADHAFHVRASSGRTDAQVREAMAADAAEWMAQVAAA